MARNIFATGNRSVRRASLRTSLFFQVFGLLVLLVILTSITAFILSWNTFKLRSIAQLQSIAQSKQVFLETTIVKQREQLSALGREPELQSLSKLTDLVGFQELKRVYPNGETEVLAGHEPMQMITEEIQNALASTKTTVFRPIMTQNGWAQYAIATPYMEGNTQIGTLIATFDPTSLVDRLLHAEYAGSTAEVLLATRVDEESIVLRADEKTGTSVFVRDNRGTTPVMAEFAGSEEGFVETTDYAGIPVLAAYRSVPSIGWTVIVKVDRYEVRKSIDRLAMNLGGTSMMLVVFLSLSTFLLARRITTPLEELAKKIDGLESKKWHFERTIFTGNELEVVDSATTDLTKRLQKSHEHLEDAVRERTRELHAQLAEDAAILETMDDGLVVTDAQGFVSYINRTAQLFTGWQEGAKDIAVGDVVRILGQDGAEISAAEHPVSIVLQTKKRYNPSSDPQFVLRSKDGKETALQVRVTPILRGQQCLGTVTVLRDTTDERRIDHMKSEFISLVSHQLRTPLSSMRWYLEMLLTGDAGSLSEDQREYVSQVSESNARMVHLINALLNVSRIELGKFQISPESIDIAQLIRTSAASFELEKKERNITIQEALPPAPLLVRSDRGLLELIVENLLSNAIKYSKEGSTVRSEIDIDEKRGVVVWTVSDTGIGIPALQQQQIGKKLFRGTNAKTSNTTGNGIGLYISMIAAETIGATIRFESAENVGTTFSVSIPMEPGQKA